MQNCNTTNSETWTTHKNEDYVDRLEVWMMKILKRIFEGKKNNDF